MTFQIISKETNQPIELARFDSIYCKFNNIKESEYIYAAWYPWLEGVYRTFTDIRDNCKGSIIYEKIIGDDEMFSMTASQVAKCLLIYEGRSFLKSQSFKDYQLEIEDISQMIKFYLSDEIKDKYYFEFDE
mgnify:FL=1